MSASSMSLQVSFLHRLFRMFVGAATLLGMVTTASAEAPSALGFTEVGRRILGVDAAASSRFAVADVDGDGVDDFIFCGASLTMTSSLLVVGKQGDASLGF